MDWLRRVVFGASLLVSFLANAATWTSPDGVELEYEVSDGGAVITGYCLPDEFSGGLEIPSTLGSLPVRSIDDYAFCSCSGLTSLTIPSSVTNIGDYAFSGCSGLTSVTIHEGVTNIGEGAFCECSSLTSVTIPSSVTNVGEYAFDSCIGLMSFIVAEDNTEYSSKNGLLLSKDGKTLLLGVNGDVAIPDGVTSIEEYAFSGCSGLTSVTIPSSVTDIGLGAFSDCSTLVSFAVANDNTEYSSKNGLLLSKDGGTLLCGVNGNVTIPDGVTSIDSYAFYELHSLISVTIPSSVTSIGFDAFFGCSSLMSFTVVDENPEYLSKNGLLLSKDGKTLLFGVNGDVTIPDGVTNIENRAFCGCSGLTLVTIPDGVTSIGNMAFGFCYGLASVTIPSSVMSIGVRAFAYCYGLTSVTIQKGVTSVGDRAFAYCTGLTSVSLPTGVTHVGEGVFEGCYKLGDVVWPSEDDEPQTGLKELYGPFVPGAAVSLDLPDLVGYAAKGLPAGLKFDSKTGKVTGAATKPTAEDGVKVTFTKKGDETLTTQFIVGPFPVLKVDLDSEMGKVTGAGAYAAGKKVTLKATAAKGCVFAGWYADAAYSMPLEGDVDYRTPSMPYVTGVEDTTVYAYFEPAEYDADVLAYVGNEHDVIDINSGSDDAVLYSDELIAEDGTVEIWVLVESLSLPTVKVAGLPAGLKYDAKTMMVVGNPTKPGTYTVKVTMSNATVKNVVREFKIIVPNLESEKISGLDPSPDAYRFVSGCLIDSAATWIAPTAEDGYTLKLSGLPSGLKYDAKTGRVTGVPAKSGTYTVTVTGTKKGEPTETATITVTVDGLPEAVAGTYIGYIADSNLAGSFTLTATAAGKLTAKIVTAQGAVSFSAPSWSRVEGSCDGGYDGRVFILGTGDEKTYRTLTVSVDAKGNMTEGSYCDGNGGIFSIDAAKNVFSSKWHFAADGSDGAWCLRSVPTASDADLTVTLKDGMATASGKVGGKKGVMDIQCGHTGGDCSGVATLVGEF